MIALDRTRLTGRLFLPSVQAALTDMYVSAIFMHMRTTIIIDDELLARARELSGLQEKTSVVHAGLRALIACEQARRLAALGGTERTLKSIPRRRSRVAGQR